MSGTRGPRSTPSAIKAVRGSWRANTNQDEPAPLTGGIARPKFDNTTSRRLWDRLYAQLNQMRVLSDTDAMALERYCLLVSRWRRAVDGDDMGVALKISEHMLRLEREFGLTPSARSNVKAIKPSEERTGLAAFALAD